MAVLCVLIVSVLFTTVFQAMTSCWLCVQYIGLAQFENQNVSRPNHDFCHFVADFKEFFVEGSGWNAKLRYFNAAKSLYTCNC